MTVKKASKKKTSKKPADSPLPLKEKTFLEEYLLDWNGTRAYMHVYKCKNENTAASLSNRLLRKVKVQEYLAKRVEERNLELRIDQTYVINKAKEIVECDYSGTVEMTESKLESLPLATRKLIQSVKIKKKTTTSDRFDTETEEVTYLVTFMSKDRAHEMLAKHTGTYAKDNERDVNLNIKGFAAIVAELEID